jgi:membrane protein implicated in regulation of membrane protease activity
MARKYIYIYYIIIGMVHGISNMGGGPLSILMSTIYSKKEIIRANIAFIYLILAVFQLLVLFIMSNANVRIEFVLLIPVSLASYFFASKYISSKVNDKKYAFVLNLMILVYGILAIIK